MYDYSVATRYIIRIISAPTTRDTPEDSAVKTSSTLASRPSRGGLKKIKNSSQLWLHERDDCWLLTFGCWLKLCFRADCLDIWTIPMPPETIWKGRSLCSMLAGFSTVTTVWFTGYWKCRIHRAQSLNPMPISALKKHPPSPVDLLTVVWKGKTIALSGVKMRPAWDWKPKPAKWFWRLRWNLWHRGSGSATTFGSRARSHPLGGWHFCQEYDHLNTKG